MNDALMAVVEKTITDVLKLKESDCEVTDSSPRVQCVLHCARLVSDDVLQSTRQWSNFLAPSTADST